MGTAPSATELIFLSTLSLRRATGRLAGYDAGNQNFYPRSPCGERHEWDRFLQIGHYFYPRSPCGERPPRLARVVPTPIFLSTLSLRRATWACLSQSMTCVFLSTLSLRRATKPMEVPQYQILISIHALLAESDVSFRRNNNARSIFLSTLSLRRATSERQTICVLYHHFYPRSPCGERPPVRDIIQWEGIFLSTLSLRRATGPQGCYTLGGVISIHALLAESDHKTKSSYIGYSDFYPRSPCGERLDMSSAYPAVQCISIHALLAESDIKSWKTATIALISIHALLAESDE